jgi:hypothetical protein
MTLDDFAVDHVTMATRFMARAVCVCGSGLGRKGDGYAMVLGVLFLVLSLFSIFNPKNLCVCVVVKFHLYLV